MTEAEPGWLGRGLRNLAFGNPIYALTLGRSRPRELRHVLGDPWPGDADKGAAILAGIYRFAGEVVEATTPNWLPVGVGDDFLAELHGFSWLRDLRAVGGDSARRHARSLVDRWLDRCGTWHPVVWRPDVLGRRIGSWLSAHDFFCASADDRFRGRSFESLAKQLRHLCRTAPGDRRGAPALAAALGLVIGGYCVPGAERAFALGVRLLDKEIGRQIRDDGGTLDRNPLTMVAVLRDLIDLRTVLTNVGGVARGTAGEGAEGDDLEQAVAPVRDRIQHAIDRLAPTVRLLRHGDGRLALFHGGQEGDAVLLDTLLSHAGARSRSARGASHAGFVRILAGRTLLLVDADQPPPPHYDTDGHAAPLAFELSVGRERMLVNCGAWNGRGGKMGRVWHPALRATAAHNTLIAGGRDCVALHDLGGFRSPPCVVRADQHDADAAVLLEAEHDGYAAGLGVTHRRRLWIAETGDDIRGEDVLTRAPGKRGPVDFAIRFHLHPDVQASRSQGGDVLVRLPSGIGWRLRASGGDLGLEESVYVGTPDAVRRTTQMVVTGRLEGAEAAVKWALKRERRG